MTQHGHRSTWRWARAIVPVLAAAGLLASACGGSAGAGSASSGSATSSHTASAGTSGLVQVLYAGSLTNTMEHQIGPAFAKATGHRYQGYGAGSTKIANEVAGKVRTGDVFISASTKADQKIMGRNLSWYATFARSPLVLAYNPHSSFADQLKSKPWYQVVTQSGFKLGLTDPKLDPKGELAATAIKQIGAAEHQPDLSQKINAHTQVYPETALLGRVQSGQLDAGFFYSIEATAQNLPTVSLKPIDEAATYTVTVLNGAPHQQAGIDFVRYLLGQQASTTLRKGGFDLVQPAKLTGKQQAVPKTLRSQVGTG